VAAALRTLPVAAAQELRVVSSPLVLAASAAAQPGAPVQAALTQQRVEVQARALAAGRVEQRRVEQGR